MRKRTKLTATCAVTAVSAVSLVGIPAASANIVEEPLINEFVTDTQGSDMLEYVEVLVPDTYDTSDLHIIGVEGDQNSNQGTAVHSYPLGDLDIDDDGRLLLMTPNNGLQNGSLTIALTDGAVATGTALDEELTGALEAPHGVEILDAVGINNGAAGAMAWGTELSATQFEDYTGTLGGASRIEDGSDNWIPNAFNGAGLGHDSAADEPRGELEAWNTPGNANEAFAEDDVNAAVEAAHAAFTTGPWSKTTPTERAETMLRIADEIEARATELSLTNTLENGSPVAETSGAAANAASIFRYFATLAPELEAGDVRPFPNGQGESLVRKDPIGVCALIAPWNFPINLMVTKLAPALLAGCTVVMKPASPTPLSFRIIVDAITAAGVPAGVVNYVTGPGRMGDLMVRHPKVAKVAFPGSTPVGRHIAAACGELLRPVTLELGGKSSAIVMEDADLDDMSSKLIRSCMRNTGQTCYISTRILAPASRYDEVVDMVTETIAAAPQGDPLDPATVFGPSANESQYNSVLDHLESAKQEGARVTTGGTTAKFKDELADGLFIQPTVLADVTANMRVAREEIFGPVITILKYPDTDEAISLTNNTEFGLGGIVFSSDQNNALQVAEAMNTGSVGINFFASNHAAPFGGRNDSGLGVEYGPEGLETYVSYKSIHKI